VTLESGARVFLFPSTATPVLSAKAAFLGGVRVEPSGKGGVTELLSRVWTSGTKDLNEAEILRKIEGIAAGLSAFGGRNSVGLSHQAISPFEKEGIELFTESLVAPVISAAAVEREKVVMIDAIRSREDSPGQLVSQMFTETMFKGHPYSRDSYGTKESVTSLTKGDVEAALKATCYSENLTLALAGSIDRDLWLDRLTEATSRLPRGKKQEAHFKHEGPKADERAFKKLDREQTHIILGMKGLTLDDSRRYTLQVIQSILAGQGGRLFLELRDKASLAYSVSPMRMEGIDTGYFGAYIGCSPEKGTKAIEMLNAEFAKLVETKVPDWEIDRAKRYLIGRHDIDLQRNSAISSSILFNEIYGIPGEEMFAYADHLRDITASDIQSLAKELFAQPRILCAVGPNEPW
ncbi:MAG TPA: pitrilysin family protein, partial [Bdellovibrionales bacterium]|nr:pitrilysin family protein [Bdellovibrionales bacterium]